MRGETHIFLILKVLLGLALFILSGITGLAQELTTINPDDIIITEIMADPQAVGDAEGEWFEIYNRTSADIDLNGCTFSDSGRDNFTVTSSLIIYSNNFLVLGKNNDFDINGGVLVDYPYSGFTLANSTDEIIITCATGSIPIDEVYYNKSKNFPIQAGASLSLKNLEDNNNDSASWCLGNSIYGAGDRGTPGGPNDECAIETNNNGSQTTKNNPPQPTVTGDTQGVINQNLHFDASQSYDPDGDDLSYEWNFGDGTTDKGKTITHSYKAIGVYQLSVIVSDGQANQSSYLTIIITALRLTDYKNKIIINELLPNPTGPDDNEWIELKNISSQTINLTGLILADASDKSYTINTQDYSNLDILPDKWLVIYKTESKLSLNNSPPETVKLLTPEGEIIDSVSYESAPQEGYAYALINGGWSWTDTPTANQANQASKQAEKESIAEQKTAPGASSTVAKKTLTTSDCENKNGQLILYELWPSPQGDDRQFEFIEIKNIGDEDIDICQWSLKDASRNYIFPEKTIVPAQEFITIHYADSKISLNNTGDTIGLYDYRGELIDETSYPQTQTDLSWSRNNQNLWLWTDQVTPGEENIFIDNFDEKITAQDNKDTNKKQYIITEIENISQYEANQKLIVEGWVTVPPGILGAQIMYITNGAGLQIYQYKKDWPEIGLDDHVRVQGTLSYPYGQPRLKMSSADDLTKLNEQINTEFIAFYYPLDELDENLLGSLITIEGETIEKNKNKIIVDDGGGEIEVYLKSSTGIVLPELNEGDILEVTGILNRSSDRWQILPRFTSDIEIVETAGWQTETPAQNDNGSDEQFKNISNFLYLTLIGIIIILSNLIYKLRRKHGNQSTTKNY